MSAADREHPAQIASFPHLLEISTRWMDMDIYGHVNNVVFYSYFDTVVNEYLMAQGVLDPETSPVIGLVVETRCAYFRSLTFPRPVRAGLKVARLGTSSVRYEIGLFQEPGAEEQGAGGDAARACAQGHFVHVYVDRHTRRPVPLPAPLKAALEKLVVRPPD